MPSLPRSCAWAGTCARRRHGPGSRDIVDPPLAPSAPRTWRSTRTVCGIGSTPRDKAEDTFRILVLGDALTAGMQVPAEDDLPEAARGAAGRSVHPQGRTEVVNAGIPGYGTADQLRYLEAFGARWQPDLLVVASYEGGTTSATTSTRPGCGTRAGASRSPQTLTEWQYRVKSVAEADRVAQSPLSFPPRSSPGRGGARDRDGARRRRGLPARTEADDRPAHTDPRGDPQPRRAARCGDDPGRIPARASARGRRVDRARAENVCGERRRPLSRSFEVHRTVTRATRSGSRAATSPRPATRSPRGRWRPSCHMRVSSRARARTSASRGRRERCGEADASPEGLHASARRDRSPVRNRGSTLRRIDY